MVLYYARSSSAALREHVIVQPQWLADVFRCLFTQHRYATKTTGIKRIVEARGVADRGILKALFEPEVRKLEKFWGKAGDTYADQVVRELRDLLVEFDLAYPKEGDDLAIVIPHLRRPSPEPWHFEAGDFSDGRILIVKLRFIPVGFVARLLCRMQRVGGWKERAGWSDGAQVATDSGARLRAWVSPRMHTSASEVWLLASSHSRDVHIGNPRDVRDAALEQLQHLLVDMLLECLPFTFAKSGDVHFDVPCLHCRKERFPLTKCRVEPQLYCDKCDTTHPTAPLLGREHAGLPDSSVPVGMGCELDELLKDNQCLKKELLTHPTAADAPAGMNQEVLQKSLELCWDYRITGVRAHRAGHIIAVGPAGPLRYEGSVRGRNSYDEGTQPGHIQTPDGMEAVKKEMNQDGMHIIDGTTGRVVAGKFFSRGISSEKVAGGAGAASAQGLSEVPGSVVFKISGDGSLTEFRLGKKAHKYGGSCGTFAAASSQKAFVELVRQENNKIKLMLAPCPTSDPAPPPMLQEALQATLALCWEYSINGIEGHRAGHVIAIGFADAILRSGDVVGRNGFNGGAECYIHREGGADVKFEMDDEGAHVVNGADGKVVVSTNPRSTASACSFAGRWSGTRHGQSDIEQPIALV